jgi:hypothetical protein
MNTDIKVELLTIIKENPKKFSIIIKQNQSYVNWVNANSTVNSDNWIQQLYSAIYQHNGICQNGNSMNFRRFNRGFYGCGPAAKCKCTADKISKSVKQSKSLVSPDHQLLINEKRAATMQQLHGVSYNSQRNEIKHIWKKPKIQIEIYEKLNDYNWMYREYITNKRTAVDIASELNVYYSTVIEYCKIHNFKIRKHSNYSIIEKQIYNYVTSLNIKCQTSNWNILANREIDIVIPHIKLGIELNGLYWHSFNPKTQITEDKFRHLSKKTEAESAGYSLLHITDWHWINKQDIVKSIIQTKLKLNRRIFARNCKIKLITNTAVIRNFYDTNHLQGFKSSKYHIGLFYEDNLIQAISIGKPSFNPHYKWELHRLCTKMGISVVGGASKLLKYAKTLINNEQIISYCDADFSNGNGYIALGFKLIKDPYPSYFWTDGNEIIPRYKTQTKELKKWLKNYDSSLSESKNLFENKYRRFSTCGNYVFVL